MSYQHKRTGKWAFECKIDPTEQILSVSFILWYIQPDSKTWAVFFGLNTSETLLLMLALFVLCLALLNSKLQAEVSIDYNKTAYITDEVITDNYTLFLRNHKSTKLVFISGWPQSGSITILCNLRYYSSLPLAQYLTHSLSHTFIYTLVLTH